jgi:two-component system sensor histidine kinase RpfC
MVLTVRSAGRALLDHINEILDFSRLEAGQMPTESVDYDLHVLFGEVIGLLNAQARAKGLRLSLHVTPRTPYRLTGDRHHLREILVNLATNAVKFTERGGVVIAVDAVASDAEEARLRFEVSDTGIGIAPDAQGRIFESFAQADETIINRYGGTGLGLAIVRQLVELHGGVIAVESQLGVGSTFSFELPIRRRTEAAEGGAGRPCRGVRSWSRARSNCGARSRPPWRPPASSRASPRGLDEARALLEGSGPEHAAVLLDAEAIDVEAGDSAALLRGRKGRAGPWSDRGATRDGLPTSRCGALSGPFWAPACRAGTARRAAARESARPDGRRDRRERAVAESGAARIGRGLRILVAEDNLTNQKVIEKVLSAPVTPQVVVSNGQEALDRLAQEPFDVALMDINMPILSGTEAAARYRAGLEGRAGVPLIALTADATPEGRRRCELPACGPA